jgi:hypothetical protein
MSKLAGVILFAGVVLGVYYLYLKKLPSTDQGTAATQAVGLTGVKMDLLEIANAERSNIALNGNCMSLNELVSSGALSAAQRERDGYTYQISCSSQNFEVTAEHPPAADGSGIRYPKLAIDGSMEVREVQSLLPLPQ